MKLSELDFEFFNTKEPHPTLVCAVLNRKKYWLLDGSDRDELIKDIQLDETYLAYYVIAEARCFIALGLDPLKLNWIDLYAEFRMQQNSNNRYQYGQYLDKDGVFKFSLPPVPGQKDKDNHAKVPSNMINAVFKNTGNVISSSTKNKMRDIILSKNTQLIEQNKQEIMDYCLEDTTYLKDLYHKIIECYHNSGLTKFEKDMLNRGAYAAATAKCEQVGIPINVNLLNKVIEKTPEILKESQDLVNIDFEKIISRKMFLPEYRRPPKVYKNGNVHNYKPEPPRKDTSAYQELIKALDIKDFPLTDTGYYSADKEVLETYRYIPVIETLYKHNKNESSLLRFKKGNSDGFFDAFGSDECVRPFYGIFGTQTGRNAAQAKTFPLAMSSWLRAIIQPKPGWYIVGADFSQQEVAVAAQLSQDKNLLNAYNSGDVYLEFAKQAGLIPHTATKKTHKAERDLCKSTVLGLQYGMGRMKLQHKLSYDSGSPVSMEKTMELINAHKTVFSTYWQWIYDVSNAYDRGYPIITPDGFVLWQDNPIKTSVRNAPVQGTSASITRQSTIDGWKANLIVMCQLHDAIYILTQNPERDSQILKQVMCQATQKILGQGCVDIRIDFKTIGHDDIWIEEKGQKEWDKIKVHLM